LLRRSSGGQAGDQTGLPRHPPEERRFRELHEPIHPDDILSIINGLSQTSPAAPFGDGAPSDPLAVTTTQPVVTAGNSGLGFCSPVWCRARGVSLRHQRIMPHGVANASQTPLTIKQGDFSTTLQVRVVNP
jgi:hypothetical protein